MTAEAQTGSKAFEGDIAELPIPELLQFLHISGRDGVLVVSDVAGKPRAVMHYVDANIVHAMCDGIAGREAVFASVAEPHSRGTAPPRRALPRQMDERSLIDELKLLQRTHWIAFASGEDVFRRVAQD